MSAPTLVACSEQRVAFDCFGGSCAISVSDRRRALAAAAAATAARARLREWHRRFSRFEADSELSRLNRDPRPEVPVSPLMARLLRSALEATIRTGGLVDATLVEEIRRAGYATHFSGPGLPLALALDLAPRRAPARPARAARSAGTVCVDAIRQTVRRPPGLAFDLGGVAKGLFADLIAADLDQFDAFAVVLAGDIRVGGTGGEARKVSIEDPFGGADLHIAHLDAGAVATSGIGRRSWLDADGRPAHHLLDPSTGLPAFTGVVQATAFAPAAAEAEYRAKAALLAGPEQAERWLPHGGFVVRDDTTCALIERHLAGVA